MPFESQRSIASPSGASINLYAMPARGTPRGVVQVNHGLAEHAARYARFADRLAEAGFHVYAHDHRGHGHTTATDAPQGTFARHGGVSKVIADIGAVHAFIAAEHPGLPVAVFGHSMGGLLALNYVLRHPKRVNAAAIWNANLSAGLLGRTAQAILAWERFRLGSDVPSRILPRLTFQAWGKAVPGHRTPFDWLSRDAAEVDKYIADPLCGWDASVSMWRDIFDLVFFGAEDRNFAGVPRTLPFNIAGGERDPATNGGKAVEDLARRMRRLGFLDIVSTVYPDTRHESLNELNRDAITDDFIAWLDRVLAAGPNAARHG